MSADAGFDMFANLDRYPDHPGFKARETARTAAVDMAPKAPRLRELCLETLRSAGCLTADQCAARLGVDKLSIRPRFSELSAIGKIIDTGVRRVNGSGKRAIAWCVAVPRRAP